MSRKAPDLPRYAVPAGTAKPLAGPAEIGYTDQPEARGFRHPNRGSPCR
jgi:hypothetical protein